MSGLDIIFLVDDPNWKKVRGLQPKLRRAVGEAVAHCRFKGNSALTVLLGSNAKLRALNREFRGKDKPTNVLSFPAAPAFVGRAAGRKSARPRKISGAHFLADAPYLGDIALAYGVTAKEAKAAGKSLSDHAAHLVVHGVLHLAGYDHERARDAKVMEPLEVKILARLGIANPYRSIDQGFDRSEGRVSNPDAGAKQRRPVARPKNKVMS